MTYNAEGFSRAKAREYLRRKAAQGACISRREGDEMACSCGSRWPVGEEHP